MDRLSLRQVMRGILLVFSVIGQGGLLQREVGRCTKCTINFPIITHLKVNKSFFCSSISEKKKTKNNNNKKRRACKQENIQADCHQSGKGYTDRGSSHSGPADENQQPCLEQSPSLQISLSIAAPCRLHQNLLLHSPAWMRENYIFILFV